MLSLVLVNEGVLQEVKGQSCKIWTGYICYAEMPITGVSGIEFPPRETTDFKGNKKMQQSILVNEGEDKYYLNYGISKKGDAYVRNNNFSFAGLCVPLIGNVYDKDGGAQSVKLRVFDKALEVDHSWYESQGLAAPVYIDNDPVLYEVAVSLKGDFPEYAEWHSKWFPSSRANVRKTDWEKRYEEVKIAKKAPLPPPVAVPLTAVAPVEITSEEVPW